MISLQLHSLLQSEGMLSSIALIVEGCLYIVHRLRTGHVINHYPDERLLVNVTDKQPQRDLRVGSRIVLAICR
jgi:hypothetical protein